jgi:hypothetical protein
VPNPSIKKASFAKMRKKADVPLLFAADFLRLKNVILREKNV